MVWSRGGDVVAVNSWQSRFGIVLIVVLGGNKHEKDPEAGSPNTYKGNGAQIKRKSLSGKCLQMRP
jgi:hypothetical protein